MSHPEPLSQWMETVSTMLPKLSRPQAKVLAYWSYGMVLARSCGITLVCAALALQVASSEQNLVQRLREWCYGAQDKKGHKRRELDVSTCFGPLLQWILAWWPADQPRLALALDATTLAKRFTVLCISVVYRGCAIPVAWKVVGALEKGAWQPHWLRLLEKVAQSVPEHWTGIVMSDRGLYAPWWYGIRSWIERGFKDTKRGGWGWHQTKMVDPERAERLWLAIAVATLWVVSVGGEVDANLPVSSLEALPQTHVARRSATHRTRPRMLSCFARGLITIVGRLIRGDGLVLGRFVPEPWPTRPSVPKKKNTKSKAQEAQEAA